MIWSQSDTNPAIIIFGLSLSVFQELQMSLISKALGILSVQNEKTKVTQNSKLAISKLRFRNFYYIMEKMSWVQPLHPQVRVAQFIAEAIFDNFDSYFIQLFRISFILLARLLITKNIIVDLFCEVLNALK